MISGYRLGRLAMMSELVLEARTAKLRKAAEAREALRARLLALDRPAPQAADDIGLAMVAYAYEGWAAIRRADIGRQLAARHAEWLIELEAARHAWGRKELLARIAARSRSSLNGPDGQSR